MQKNRPLLWYFKVWRRRSATAWDYKTRLRRRFAISQPSFASLITVLRTTRFLTLVSTLTVLLHGETTVSPTPFPVRFSYAAKEKAFAFSFSVRRRRIELLSQPWQGRVLPLNQHRNFFIVYHTVRFSHYVQTCAPDDYWSG